MNPLYLLVTGILGLAACSTGPDISDIPTSGSADSTIVQGYVRERNTDIGVPNVECLITEGPYILESSLTGPDGYFRLKVKTGKYPEFKLHFQSLGEYFHGQMKDADHTIPEGLFKSSKDSFFVIFELIPPAWITPVLNGQSLYSDFDYGEISSGDRTEAPLYFNREGLLHDTRAIKVRSGVKDSLSLIYYQWNKESNLLLSNRRSDHGFRLDPWVHDTLQLDY